MPDCSKNLFSWTVIPTGWDANGHQQVAVHLALRLGPPPPGKPEQLSSYADFVDWPATIANLKPRFQLQFYDLEGSGGPREAIDTELLSSPSSDIWKHLFPGETHVRTCKRTGVADAEPRKNRRYESYSVRNIADHTEKLYRGLAEQSFAKMQRDDKPGSTYRTRFANSALAPTARPTVVEARDRFASLHVFQPQTPSEGDRYCLEVLEKFFADWVDGHTEKPPIEIRRKIREIVQGYVNKLQPPLNLDEVPATARRLLKPSVFKALVGRAFKELGLNKDQPQPEWPMCPGQSVSADSQPGSLDVVDLIEHSIFHRALPRMCPKPRESTPYDFHELMSMLSSHPDLYSQVGLVFDLRVATPMDLTTHELGRVSVKVSWGSPLSQSTDDRYPLTAYELLRAADTVSPPRFFPCSRSAANSKGASVQEEDIVRRGVLDVSDTNRFHIQTLDTHGDYFKAQGMQSNEAATSPDRRKTERDESIPKLRSCGLALVRDKRATKVEAILNRNVKMQSELDAGNRVTFYAEDLTLGYRVDVLVANEAKAAGRENWNSLCQRSTKYEFITSTGETQWNVVRTIEGYRPDIASAKGAGNHAYERLCQSRLEGIVQSSAARAADAKDSEFQLLETMLRWENWSLAAPLPVKNPTTPAYDFIRKPLRLRATHTVSKSLPHLKFGNGYYLRCRAAFLDGSGLSVDECDAGAPKLGGPKGEPYRFERIESVDSPVVLLDDPINLKETPGEQLAHLVLRNGDDTAVRYVVPPRVSPHMALLHGVFDKSRKGAFGDYIWNEDGAFAAVCQLEGKADCAAKATNRTDGNAIFRQFSGIKFQLKHPYLPDPAAQRLQLTLLHRRSTGNDLGVAVFDFYSSPEDWPDAGSLEIRLEGPKDGQTQDAVLEFNQADGSILVNLQKGRTASLILTPTLQGANLNGIPLVQIFKFGGKLTEQMGPSRAQLHWLLVSDVKLDLVHAVEQPLRAPVLESIVVAQRPVLNSNSVKLRASLSVDPDSSGEIDVAAQWTDPVSDGSDCGTKNSSTTITTRAHVYSHKVELSEFETGGENVVSVDLDHLIGDTKYHKITYSASGKSRFAPYYPEYQKVIDNPRDEVLAAQFINKGDSKEKTLYICNRGIPDTPKILYIIPLFRWDTAETDHGRKHRRHGGGLRIYMESQWNSTGEGELLGVVLGERPHSLTPEVGTLVTQWGIDPLWEANSLPQPPTIDDFEGMAGFIRHCENSTAEEHSFSGLRTTENSDVVVTALGFSPQPDCGGMVRHCDVVMRPRRAYYPFVRLALARFQPNSVEGAHLSKIVTADFMQLAPDRWVVTYFRHHKLQVYVYGFTYRSSFAAAHGSEMDICVEKRVMGRDSDFCWVPAIDPKTGREVRKRAPAGDLSVFDRLTIGTGLPDEAEKGMSVWHAEFDLKGVSLGSDHRVIVQEIETYQADDRSKQDSTDSTVNCERVVFADALKI